MASPAGSYGIYGLWGCSGRVPRILPKTGDEDECFLSGGACGGIWERRFNRGTMLRLKATQVTETQKGAKPPSAEENMGEEGLTTEM
jgi:hypothetical protein